METPLEIRWSRIARKEARTIYAWYKKNIGISTADKFINGILHTVELLALNPNMGHPVPLSALYKKEYRIFVEHKNHSIIYYVKKNTLNIHGIWPNSQNPKDIDKRLK
ncbi:type II toxin-antitoxin system RelE/ParE family toxin [Parabacteroides johnsonii]|uniref:type II toxin-antitoxin system RelE/ParE family toxin n=1 Tax=Parabacteroides johnsonii TaxID=387661 RepID=UPI00307F5D94